MSEVKDKIQIVKALNLVSKSILLSASSLPEEKQVEMIEVHQEIIECLKKLVASLDMELKDVGRDY